MQYWRDIEKIVKLRHAIWGRQSVVISHCPSWAATLADQGPTFSSKKAIPFGRNYRHKTLPEALLFLFCVHHEQYTLGPKQQACLFFHLLSYKQSFICTRALLNLLRIFGRLQFILDFSLS